ncbi:hypothetical protein BDZ89DRAFT_1197951, partial [Hymenopellis radicata]
SRPQSLHSKCYPTSSLTARASIWAAKVAVSLCSASRASQYTVLWWSFLPFRRLSLDNEALASIFTLLSSSSYTKIMFDGRMDYAALFHEHGVELQNVLDLQLAEVSCRTESSALSRLSECISPIHIQRRELCKLRMLAGLGMCVRVYGASSEPDGGKADFNHSLWLRRPLPPQYLEYAAKDVVLIAKLYHAFVRRGFRNCGTARQSQRYISLFKAASHSPGDALSIHILSSLWTFSTIRRTPLEDVRGM